jgi:5'(3')-deoxyribonucleotidase
MFELRFHKMNNRLNDFANVLVHVIQRHGILFWLDVISWFPKTNPHKTSVQVHSTIGANTSLHHHNYISVWLNMASPFIIYSKNIYCKIIENDILIDRQIKSTCMPYLKRYIFKISDISQLSLFLSEINL